MSGSWEVVKTQKKSKIPQHVGQKNKKKGFNPDSMPKIEPSAPVKESPTIYEAFIEKQPPSRIQPLKEPEKSAGNGVGSNSNPKKSNLPKKKSDKTQEKKQPKFTLENAVKEITVDDLQAVLVKDQETFPDNHALWLMDIASLINLKLDLVAEGDPVRDGKPKDYPLCLLSKDSRKLISGLIKQCSPEKLQGLMEQCINHMLMDLGKESWTDKKKVAYFLHGVSTHGYRMFIQLLAKEHPDAIMNYIPRYVDMIKNNQNRHLRCLSVMWAVGQVGHIDFCSGIRVWFTVMLPFLNIRALAGYIIEYLDRLLAEQRDLKKVVGCVNERQYFQLFDLVHGQQFNLPANQQKKLAAVYPKVKLIALTPGPAGLSKVFFPSFLKRCEPNCGEAQQAELVDCLVICLKESKLTFSQWRQMYTKFLPQSSVLLQHLSENWVPVGSKLDRKLLKETIDSFTLTNEDLAKKGNSNNQQCDEACKDITAKLSSRRFKWSWLFIFVALLCSGVVGYDVYLHKSLHASKTYRILSDAGVLVFLEQVWSRVLLYSGKVWSWLCDNVPHYYAKVSEFVGPYLVIFWARLWEFGLFMAEATKPIQDWLYTNVSIALNWVNAQLPWIWSYCTYYAGIAAGYIVKYSLLAWEFLCYYSFIVGTWLQENVFTGEWSVENIQKVVLSWLEVLRTFLVQCAVKISDTFAAMKNSS